MLLENGNGPWGTHDGQCHSSDLIHCTRDSHQKYSVDDVAECSEISTHGLERRDLPGQTGTERLLVAGQNRGHI